MYEIYQVGALRVRGVHSQAVVIVNDFKGDGWTRLSVMFTTREGQERQVLLVHQGQVKATPAELVSIVYDPHDPTNARLAGDLSVGTLIAETVEGILSVLGEETDPLPNGDPVFGLLGLAVLLSGAGVLRSEVVPPVRQVRRLRQIARHSATRGTPMQIQLGLGHGGDQYAYVPAIGIDDWLYVPLLPSPAVKDLTGQQLEVEAFGALATRWPVLMLRLPDGRLLWSAGGAKQLHDDGRRRGGYLDRRRTPTTDA